MVAAHESGGVEGAGHRCQLETGPRSSSEAAEVRAVVREKRRDGLLCSVGTERVIRGTQPFLFSRHAR